jgi:DNA-directed RNA polymerase sigma subunit (sigma70/sigma32)
VSFSPNIALDKYGMPKLCNFAWSRIRIALVGTGPAQDKVKLSDLEALLDGLSPRYRKAVRRRFGLGKSGWGNKDPVPFRVLAKEMGISNTRARDIVERALGQMARTLRKQLKDVQ